MISKVDPETLPYQRWSSLCNGLQLLWLLVQRAVSQMWLCFWICLLMFCSQRPIFHKGDDVLKKKRLRKQRTTAKSPSPWYITHGMSLFYPKRRCNKETVISQYFSESKGNTLKSLTGIKNRLPTLTIPTNTTSKCNYFMHVYRRFLKFVP